MNTLLDIDDTHQPTILCVDDEAHILSALKRLLRKTGANVLTADNAEQAFALLKQHAVDVVLSDMRMPNTSGSELLDRVAQHYPHIYRIVLTGYADLSSTIAAINQGKVDQYLQKPWDNTELLNTLRIGCAKARENSKRAEYSHKASQQNKKLRALNQSLGSQVKTRTSQVKVTLGRLHQAYQKAHDVLFNCIDVHPHLEGNFGRKVSTLAYDLALQMNVPEKHARSIKGAGLLNEIGMLGLEAKLITSAFVTLNARSRDLYLQQSQAIDLLLAPLGRFATEANILRYQFEQPDGKGVYNMPPEEIPLGARIVAVARDYWRYRDGRMFEYRLSPQHALTEMQKYTDIKYFADVLKCLNVLEQSSAIALDENDITCEQLCPGMVLLANVYNENDILLLPKDHLFTEQSVTKLQQYDRSQGAKLHLRVKR